MIHIKKSDSKFFVHIEAGNKEILSNSEIFNSKQSAIKNIMAQAKEFGSKEFSVMDETKGQVITFKWDENKSAFVKTL